MQLCTLSLSTYAEEQLPTAMLAELRAAPRSADPGPVSLSRHWGTWLHCAPLKVCPRDTAWKLPLLAVAATRELCFVARDS